MPVTFPACIESENVLCKHVRAVRDFYADLNWLPDGVTVVSATGDTEDPDLIVESVTVLEEDVLRGDCTLLYEGRALLIELSGGVESDDEVIVTLNWVQSNGYNDSRAGRLLVEGRA